MQLFAGRWSLIAVVLVLMPLGARGEIKLVGVGTIRGTATDLSSLNDTLSDGTPHNRLGGLGSAIAYTGAGNRYILAADRGPADGGTEFLCRVHALEIAVDPEASPAVMAKLLATTLLSDEHQRKLPGAMSAFDTHDPARGMRLDPEGIRMSPTGTLFISDEYGPSISEFASNGRRLRSLKLPDRFLISHPAAKQADELPPNNFQGRQANRGMEGLAISPRGDKIFGIMQSPLIQDGGLDADNKRVGINCRLVVIDLASGATRELVYQLDSASHGVSEIVATGDHEFLVLERDGKAGTEARAKKVFQVDIAQATDVGTLDKLPRQELPADVKPVAKTLFLDLLDRRLGLAGADMPEKPEGLAFGPDLPDGRLLLLVTVDNDFASAVPTSIYAFAIDAADLSDYRPQSFTSTTASK